MNVHNQLHECTKGITICSKERETAFMMCTSRLDDVEVEHVVLKM